MSSWIASCWENFHIKHFHITKFPQHKQTSHCCFITMPTVSHKSTGYSAILTAFKIISLPTPDLQDLNNRAITLTPITPQSGLHITSVWLQLRTLKWRRGCFGWSFVPSAISALFQIPINFFSVCMFFSETWTCAYCENTFPSWHSKNYLCT